MTCRNPTPNWVNCEPMAPTHELSHPSSVQVEDTYLFIKNLHDISESRRITRRIETITTYSSHKNLPPQNTNIRTAER